MKPLYKKLIIPAVVLILVTAYLLVANKTVGISEFEFSDADIPDSFNGFRIVHVSDLHNESFGEDNEKLLSDIEALKPDIIAITGDIVDSRRTDIEKAVFFASKAVAIAPVYYVTGNHEARIDSSDKLFSSLEEVGVKLLRDEKCSIEKEGEQITLYGIDDPMWKQNALYGEDRAIIAGKLMALDKGDDFSLLLAHHPEFFDIYTAYGFDLVLSGHAHAGQFRIPFIGGVYAPGQGFFPKYSEGLYSQGDTSMIVSRGLGNSIIPLRINNNPELILITLTKEAE